MSKIQLNHENYMQYAIQLAQNALNEGEVPVGSLLVRNNQIISKGWNQSIGCHDPTSHAEIIALRKGGMKLKNYRLLGCTLYVTLEPCIMCSGAMIHGRISTLVYGSQDKKTGAAGSLVNIFQYPHINHQILVIGGVLASACSEILKNFFYMRRLQKKK